MKADFHVPINFRLQAPVCPGVDEVEARRLADCLERPRTPPGLWWWRRFGRRPPLLQRRLHSIRDRNGQVNADRFEHRRDVSNENADRDRRREYFLARSRPSTRLASVGHGHDKHDRAAASADEDRERQTNDRATIRVGVDAGGHHVAYTQQPAQQTKSSTAKRLHLASMVASSMIVTRLTRLTAVGPARVPIRKQQQQQQLANEFTRSKRLVNVFTRPHKERTPHQSQAWTLKPWRASRARRSGLTPVRRTMRAWVVCAPTCK